MSEETRVSHTRSDEGLAEAEHEAQPAQSAADSDRMGIEAAWGGADLPLPLGN